MAAFIVRDADTRNYMKVRLTEGRSLEVNQTKDLSGQDLSLAIAKILVEMGQLEHETMQEGYYDHQIYEGVMYNPLKVWITLLDGDELWGELNANYATDINIAFTLTIEGWPLKIEEWVEAGKPNTWLATYYNNQFARGCGSWGNTPAEAICRARLTLNDFIHSNTNRQKELEKQGYKVRHTEHGWYPVSPQGTAIIRGWAKTEDAAWEHCDHHSKGHPND